MPVYTLPILPTAGPRRLRATDITQFVRLDQCERFLRFRLAENAGQDFMRDYGVAPQPIPPLLALSGGTFEETVEDKLTAGFPAVHFAAQAKFSHQRPPNNADLAAEARSLKPGDKLVCFQTRLVVPVDGWELRGDVDLVRLERLADGRLDVLVADLKSSTSVKVEHRLQVGFYRLMLAAVFDAENLAHDPIRLGVVYRPPVDPEPEEAAEVAARQAAAADTFGLADALLEVVPDPQVYEDAARDLALAPAAVARRVADAPFADLPFGLSYKCDGCLYNEFCLKWAAEADDLSLLPFLTDGDKQALLRAGVRTNRDLATLKDFAPPGPGVSKGDLVPAKGREPQAAKLAATWPVGPRVDELVHRAKAFRRFARGDDLQTIPFLPGKGNSTLPVAAPDRNANLVLVFVDAQADHRHDRVYLLAARVVAHKNGEPTRPVEVVRMTAGPPDTAANERELLVRWTADLVKAVVKSAAAEKDDKGRPTAPVHVVFFDEHDQRVLLDALARNFPPILKNTPPLYDFLTQLATFDAPVCTFLADEVRAFKNYPMVCQTLQSLATFLGFKWDEPEDYRARFRAGLFDYVGKADIEGQSQWYTKRARFSSAIPLEYAYAAWGALPAPEPKKGDPFADYRGVTRAQVEAFAARRLAALEHVARKVGGNPDTTRTPYVLPDLAHFEQMADSLAGALREFVAIERLADLAEWRQARHAPPERRVLMGETLLVRYREADQDKAELKLIREAHKAEKLKLAGRTIRLRVEAAGLACDVHDVLGLTNVRDGARLVLSPRWTTDERLPVDQRRPHTPTPKQVLYNPRVDLVRLVATRNKAGRVTEAVAEVTVAESRFVKDGPPFVFPAFDRPLVDGDLYTLDPCPNDWIGLWCREVVDGLCAGEPNVLYGRLAAPPAAASPDPTAGQARFLAGLDAFHSAGHLHDFEPAKRDYIGGHGRTPVLLVQGPPGTGKSYSTAFAVFARIQGAMADGRPCRVFVSCHTHAAIDVLVENVRDVQQQLARLRKADRKLFDRYFDKRLLDVPLFRVAPNDPPKEGIKELAKDAEKKKGETKNADRILAEDYVVVGLTPGAVRQVIKGKWGKELFGQELCDLLVLDEASQMNLPAACMAALALTAAAQVIVVGDHRQMPPIIKHDWDAEARRTFRAYQVYESLFDTLRQRATPIVRFAESFRLHAGMAEFLRQEVYRHDGIAFHSNRRDVLPARPHPDPFVAAVLAPEYPLVIVVHGEAASQLRNPFEQDLAGPILKALAASNGYGLDAETGLGVVVPHRAQRAALQEAFPELSVLDPATGLAARSAIDTVERFQGGERTVIVVSATESDPGYLLACGKFLFDPRRLTVALSRAKRKLILVAARSVFGLFSPDEETFANAQMWKNLLRRTCAVRLWAGDRAGVPVEVWGGPGRVTGG